MIKTETEIKITRAEKEKALKDALKNGGFYGTNGVWNSLIKILGDNHVYRKRVETIIIRDNKEIFLKKRPDNSYFFPGGSTEKNIPDYMQAINECREEARINIRNIESTGLSYKELKKENSVKDKEFLITWDGSYTDIYIAEYDSRYKGHVDKVDKDSFIESGRFYPTKEAFTFLSPIHREALVYYLKNHIRDDEMIIESTKSKSVFFVSEKNFDGKTLQPRIPDNFFTRHGYENNETPRVCFSTSISGCLIGLSKNLAGQDLYVHTPVGNGNIIKPTREDVPEILYSKERWTLDPVKLKMVGQIHVDNANDKPYKFKYGDNITGETYSWNWRWIQENTTNENGEPDMKEFTNEDLRLAIVYEAVYENAKLNNWSDGQKANLFLYLESVTKEEVQKKKEAYEDAKKRWRRWNRISAASSRTKEESEFYYSTDTFKISREIDKAKYAYEDALAEYRKDAPSLKERLSDQKEKLSERLKNKSKAVTEAVIDALDDVLTEALDEGCITESTNEEICDAFMMEKALSTAERDSLPNKSFGIPEERKYPLNNESHVRYAISMFNKVEKKYEEQLARNIKRAMRKFGIDKESIGPKNRLANYF